MNAEVRSQNAEVTSTECSDLKVRTKRFALRVIRLYGSLPRKREAWVIGDQLLRSASSVGANYRAACRARSRTEFVAKLGIVLEEADETVFWLELLRDANIFRAQKMDLLIKEADALTSIFVASLRTAKGLSK